MASQTKRFRITPAATSGLGDWCQVEVTDAAFCAIPQGDGDISAVEVATGRAVPVYVLTRTPSLLRVTVALSGPISSSEPRIIDLTVTDTGNPNAQATWSGRSDACANPVDVGPDTLVSDGVGNTIQSDVWIHPQVFRVSHIADGENGYWMRFSSLAARASNTPDVTHIRIDTPFPVEKWEQPYVLISTDGAATWSEPAAGINPVDPWGGGTTYHSDPCAILRPSDGALLVFYREFTDQQRLHYNALSGTCWEDASKGARQTPTGSSGWTAPSIVNVGGTFVMMHRSGGSVLLLTSSDEGDTWTLVGTAFEDTVGRADGEYARGWWHGSLSGRIDGGPMPDGYYYACWVENWTGNANDGAGRPRIWRTTDPLADPFDAGRMYGLPWSGAPAWASSGWYQACVFEQSDGSLGLCASGYTGGQPTTAQVGITDYDPTTQALTENAAFQWGTGGAGGQDTEYKTTVDRGVVTELDPVEYRAEYSTNGTDWSPVADWTRDLSVALDTTDLPDGALQLRVQARDAAAPTDLSGYDTVSITVANIEYRVTYHEDGGVETIAQDWTANDLSEAINTSLLADGPLVVRVYARDAANPADVSSPAVLNLTVSNGAAVTVAPSFIASTATVYAPTLVEGVPPGVLAPAFIAATSEVYSPTITEGVPAGTLAPAFVTAASEVYAPALVPGSAVIAPAFIESVVEVYAPIVGLVDVGAFQTVRVPGRRFTVTPPVRRF